MRASSPDVGRKRLVRLKDVDPSRYLIETGQRLIDDRGIGLEAAGVNRRQQVFRGMQRQPHRRQIDHAGRAFERMEGAEDAIDPLGGKSFAFQRDQIVGCLLDQLARFDDELLVQGVHDGAPASTATWRTRVGLGDRLDQIEIGARSPGIVAILLVGFGGDNQGRQRRHIGMVAPQARAGTKARPSSAC